MNVLLHFPALPPEEPTEAKRLILQSVAREVEKFGLIETGRVLRIAMLDLGVAKRILKSLQRLRDPNAVPPQGDGTPDIEDIITYDILRLRTRSPRAISRLPVLAVLAEETVAALEKDSFELLEWLGLRHHFSDLA